MKTISNTDVVQVKFQKRNIKDQAHTYFDMIWRFGYATRNETYKYLADWLGVDEPHAHMSQMGIKECKQVIEFSIQRLNDMRRLDLDFGDPIKHPYFELINN